MNVKYYVQYFWINSNFMIVRNVGSPAWTTRDDPSSLSYVILQVRVYVWLLNYSRYPVPSKSKPTRISWLCSSLSWQSWNGSFSNVAVGCWQCGFPWNLQIMIIIHCVRFVLVLQSLNRASWYTYVRKTNKMHAFLSNLFHLTYHRHYLYCCTVHFVDSLNITLPTNVLIVCHLF